MRTFAATEIGDMVRYGMARSCILMQFDSHPHSKEEMIEGKTEEEVNKIFRDTLNRIGELHLRDGKQSYTVMVKMGNGDKVVGDTVLKLLAVGKKTDPSSEFYDGLRAAEG